MQLDRRSGVPLYLQIEERIRLGIAQGVWQAGSVLPPEEELCRILQVSRGPVRQALGRLAQEGLVVRDRRRGTRVLKTIPVHGLILVSPYRAIQVAGMKPVVRVLAQALRRLPDEVRRRWRRRGVRAPRGRGVFVERVFEANGDPVVHARSWFPADRLGRLISADLAARPLLDILAQDFGLVITRMEETMELTTMPLPVARLLRVRKGSPCLAVTICQWAGAITGLLALESATRRDGHSERPAALFE